MKSKDTGHVAPIQQTELQQHLVPKLPQIWDEVIFFKDLNKFRRFEHTVSDFTSPGALFGCPPSK